MHRLVRWNGDSRVGEASDLVCALAWATFIPKAKDGAGIPAVMRVLVVGGGGREHAIAEALLESGAELYAVARNRNPGIARRAKAYLQASETDVEKVVQFAAGARVEFAVIGPEAPLAAGLVDAL